MTISDEQRQALEESSERVDAAKATFDDAKVAREALIHQVALDGASYREVADATGLSHQRVHQLLTGEKKPTIPWGTKLLFHCPRCKAKPTSECVDDKGKRRSNSHIERSNRATHVLYLEDAEPLPDEPGPHTTLYQAQEQMRLGWQGKGPIYLDPASAGAYAMTLPAGSYVGRWTGHKWEAVE